MTRRPAGTTAPTKIYRQPRINDWVDPIRRLKEDFLDVLDDPERCVAAAE